MRLEKTIATQESALFHASPRRWPGFPGWFGHGPSPWNGTEPIRAELVSLDKLEQQATNLALDQRGAYTASRGSPTLRRRMRENGAALRRDYQLIALATSGRRSVPPAAQWFIDNYYLVERQLRLVRDDLPTSYYRQLPKLARGPLRGMPRITGMAWDFVAHTDSAFDASMLIRFVQAYQRIEVLTIGELWALASMLRVVLLENLRRCADRIVDERRERDAADEIADRLLGSPTRESEPLTQVVAGGLPRPLPRAFAVQLVRRFRDVDRSDTPAVSWLEQTLLNAGLNAESMVLDELQSQGATNVTVQNIVTSLTQLAARDWAETVESLSAVDAALRAGSLFGSMDFASRNCYRTAIEELARHSGMTELEIARRALTASRTLEAPALPVPDPGWQLIGPERAGFEAAVGYRPPLRQRLQRMLTRAGIGGYIGTQGILTLLVLGAASQAARLAEIERPILWPLLLTSILPIGNAIAALVNALYARLLPPRILPALDLAGAVPASARTLVVIPVLLSAPADVHELIEHLEAHFLSSARGELYFALLADGADADAPELAEDAAVIAAGRRGIQLLNERYGPGANGNRFLWLYRRRRWNPAQRRWMGWERKRGKLHELNHLLRGARDTSYLLDEADYASLPGDVRYVLALDADTQLSPGAAEKLLGKLAHPLNQARLAPDERRVISGYGILQPLVVPTLPSDPSRSVLQDMLSGSAGLDPYAFAVSDLYQDLCGEGSYTGKGLYEIDIFESCLSGRIADNTILSHDLLESLLARAALASDVAVLEPAPDRYDVAASREHRWARGDWQLLPWLLRALRGTAAGTNAVRISTLGCWKILDNLRRTMLAPATLIALLASWWLPLRLACYWNAILIIALVLPALIPIFQSLGSRPSHLRWARGRQSLRRELRLVAEHLGLQLALLCDRAARMADAIARTLWRLTITRRHLLDWTTAAQSRRASRVDPVYYVHFMAMGLGLGLLIAALMLYARPASGALALPWVAAWLASPWIANRVSGPRPTPPATRLNDADYLTLRLAARQTWGFFERFVTAAEHHLPPDNFQESPQPAVAHRTSPTNVGLYLLASASAYQFGWLGLYDWADRLEATFGALERLARHRGHFLNWYDTRTLMSLQPLYVSTVDSGNLAGHLLTLANAIEAASNGPLWGQERWAGIRDALALADGEVAAESQDPVFDPFRAVARAASTAFGGEGMATSPAVLRHLASVLPESPRPSAADDTAIPSWSRVAAACVRSHLRDADMLAPQRLNAAPGSLPGARFTATALSDLVNPGVADLGEAQAARELLTRLRSIADTARRLADEMDFSFLLDPERQLLAIGYRVNEARLDSSHYDLLASESRLASYIAVAKRDVPTRHWFRLGRALTPVGDSAALISWAGSMFEYLMPSLIMAEPPGSLLGETTRAAVRCQREYAASRGLPWGISESAYNQRDVEQTYQYSPFGVPALGLKRDLADNAVISPYSTALAAMVEPRAATLNLRALRTLGAAGDFGYFEALDFTPTRLAEGERMAIVRAYMAHHQGMTIVALANALNGGLMRRYFHAEPMVRAVELLLQERPPRFVEESLAETAVAPVESPAFARIGARRRRIQTWRPATPQSQLLSNGRYTVLVNAAGSGCSSWNDLAVTRWHEDRTPDESGQAIYLRDVESGAVWSAGYHPTASRPDGYQVTFSEDRVEIVRRDGSMSTTLEVLVSAELDAEARRVSITNRGNRAREIEVTSYAELVLTSAAADRAHRAFSNLFVETSYVPELEALLAVRHPRASVEPAAWAAHLAVVEGQTVGPAEYETDRALFLGRRERLTLPRALQHRDPLSATVGHVLDPVFSLRRRVQVARGGTARVTFWTAVTSTREAALQLIDKCRDASAFGRASTLAWTRAQVQLHHIGIDAEEAGVFQRLASHLFYFNPALRAGNDILRLNRGGPPDLWALGVSGDRPIVLAQIDAAEQLELIRQLVRAHEYWSLQNLAVDLIILNETADSYSQELQASLQTLAYGSMQRAPSAVGKGAVFTLRAALIAAPSRQALTSAARAILVGRRGSLVEQLDRLESVRPSPEVVVVAPPARPRSSPPPELAHGTMELFNGLGGFIHNGLEYLVALPPRRCTPLPWINVIAQPDFGFQVSAEGTGFTWSRNSRQNPLTSWSNDPIGDPSSEAFYIRDDDTDALWSPTAAPIRDPEGHYFARHGQGYSIFEYHSRGIALTLTQFIPRDSSFKVSRLELRNDSGRIRKLSVCAYVEWALGPGRAANAPFIITERCTSTGALLARNPWNTDFATRVAFLDMCGLQTSGTADRREFLGQDGSVESPAALTGRGSLVMRFGAGLDPCGALMTRVLLNPGESRIVHVLLGEADQHAGAVAMINAARAMDLQNAYADLRMHWDQILGAVQITTNDRSLDLLMNRWLLYQTISCRIWARSAFYQASGAYGYRDQLQDGMALTVAAPHLTREHLLRAAGRQFEAGDVQHWWMPETGRGIRTRTSDDRVWLPYCVAQYLQSTGDTLLLEEPISFLSGEALASTATDSYFVPGVTEARATMFEHCARALDTSLALGPHGLPLMGTGDWNDGFNSVGAGGRGESVWLGWFLCSTLSAFIPLAEARGESARAARWQAQVRKLSANLELAGWDGDWYRRGYFDDGTALGSALNSECRIDSIAQSWSVLSNAANPARAAHAMAAVCEHLWQPENGLALLFTPPFVDAHPDPGYIKAYPPGVRENGGQYTHGAIWSLMAFAQLGDGTRAKQWFDLLNPINHTRTSADVDRYRLEPYVVAADVYAASGLVGRGGWSWYTGSAGWLYRAGLESMLGFRLQGSELLLEPCIPRTWRRFDIAYRYRSSRYQITVTNPFGVSAGVNHAEVDHRIILRAPIRVQLLDDGAEHVVRLVMG